MRSFWLFLLLLSTLAVAQSQEDLYYRALKAEEAGDISLALKIFEEALATPGPYTEELQEIVNEYREALGDTASTWEFHTYGNVGYMWLNYKPTLSGVGETGGEILASLSASMDYNTRNWIHSFEINLSGDWFVDKEDMPSLDTSTWEGSFGVEYNLIGNSLLLDVGANMNASEEEGWNPDFFLLLEKFMAHFGKQRLGAALWGYENFGGPLSAALYVTLHRYAEYGLSGSLYAGGLFEADSISSPEYWIKWLGPSLKSSISYKFKTEVSVDAKLNLFYGFVVDGPNADYRKMQRLSGFWGLSASWTPRYFGLFVGLDQFLNCLKVPPEKKKDKASFQKSLYSQLKAGVKWNI